MSTESRSTHPNLYSNLRLYSQISYITIIVFSPLWLLVERATSEYFWNSLRWLKNEYRFLCSTSNSITWARVVFRNLCVNCLLRLLQGQLEVGTILPPQSLYIPVGRWWFPIWRLCLSCHRVILVFPDRKTYSISSLYDYAPIKESVTNLFIRVHGGDGD